MCDEGEEAQRLGTLQKNGIRAQADMNICLLRPVLLGRLLAANVSASTVVKGQRPEVIIQR